MEPAVEAKVVILDISFFLCFRVVNESLALLSAFYSCLDLRVLPA